MRFLKVFGYMGCGIGFTGLLWGTVIPEMGLPIAVVGIIIMLITLFVTEEF